MNDNDNAAYYLSRAEQEDEAASKAANPIAATIHRSLANRYRAKAGELDGRQEQLSVVREVEGKRIVDPRSRCSKRQNP